MVIYQITYELNNKYGDYSNFNNEIESFPAWYHCLSSTSFVHTELNANAIHDYLFPNIYDGDRLLITAIKGDYHGWVTKDFWEWLDERL